MRNLNECRAEVFRRSENRIQERKKRRNRALACCIPLCLLMVVCAAVPLLPKGPANDEVVLDGAQSVIGDMAVGDQTGNHDGNSGDKLQDGVECIVPEKTDFGSLDSFSFSLSWDCRGISSYDSKTGKLVKTTDATHPEDYVTTYQLTAEQKQRIFDLIKGLEVATYPDTYDPHGGGVMSSPPMTLVLSVKTDKVQKSITAADIAYTFDCQNSQGQRFLSVCKAIQDILTETEEWKALPEYEVFYN